MENPAEDIFEPLTWLSSRKKVFNIHFRNIKGNRNHYAEVAPDEGEADFTRAVLVLAQNDYDGHITPDHNVRRGVTTRAVRRTGVSSTATSPRPSRPPNDS